MAVRALNAMTPVQRAGTPMLTVSYYDVGTGPAVVLLHGFPYDIHAYADVAPMLAAAGFRVIVPYLRGCGATRFRDATVPRTAEQAALASDIIDLLDCLDLPQAVLGGFDWGARAACAAAALWPERCTGLVSAGGYVIHDLERATIPAAPERECALWYQYYLATERGRAGLTANRRELSRLLWRQWSPLWRFSEAEFERTAAAFDNPDWVEVALHNYRHKLGAVPGYSRYANLARQLQGMPRIEVPTVTLDGGAHGVVPASDGSQWRAYFRCHLEHRVAAGAGHNIPQEQPRAFAQAVLALTKPSSSLARVYAPQDILARYLRPACFDPSVHLSAWRVVRVEWTPGLNRRKVCRHRCGRTLQNDANSKFQKPQLGETLDSAGSDRASGASPRFPQRAGR